MEDRRLWQPEKIILQRPGNLLTIEQQESDQHHENRLTLSKGTRTMVRMLGELGNNNRYSRGTSLEVTHKSSTANNQRDEEAQEQLINEACDIAHADVATPRILVLQGLVSAYNAEQETNGTAQREVRDMGLLCEHNDLNPVQIETVKFDNDGKATENQPLAQNKGKEIRCTDGNTPRIIKRRTRSTLGIANVEFDCSGDEAANPAAAKKTGLAEVKNPIYGSGNYALLFLVILFVCAVYAMTRCLFE